jgi:translation initiation factor IF-1
LRQSSQRPLSRFTDLEFRRRMSLLRIRCFARRSLKMEKEPALELEGKVVEVMKSKFRVQIPNKDPNAPPFEVLAHLSGKLRKNFIKITPGDQVKVEVTPYDLTRGRITFRLK